MPNKNELYFDIETTGLGVWKSHLTVIGCGFINDLDEFEVKQFIVEKPSLENKALKDFSEFASGFDTFVHFNGKSFDIPYVQKKLEFYGFSDIFAEKESKDLYVSIKPLKKLFDLPDLKQKSVEKLLNIKRKDTISGFECISCYQKYLESGDEEYLDKLLLHNYEDVRGLYEISKLENCECLLHGDYDVSGYTENDEGLVISLVLNNDLSISISKEAEDFSLKASGREAFVTLQKYTGELKYYFSDWKDYFYLPAEGRAVHKSIGCYVDKEHRQKATKETACEPVSGVFYRQPEAIITPSFRNEYKGREFFRMCDKKSNDQLRVLVEAVMQFLKQ